MNKKHKDRIFDFLFLSFFLLLLIFFFVSSTGCGGGKRYDAQEVRNNQKEGEKECLPPQCNPFKPIIVNTPIKVEE